MVSIGETIEMIVGLTGTNKPIEAETTRLRPAQSEVLALMAAPDRLHAAAGWLAGTTLEDGLGQTIDWWRRRLAGKSVRQSASYMT